jgi:AraC-like DNA-binding protein
MQQRFEYRQCLFPGVELMRAFSADTLHRHTHDHFGIGVIDYGGHASLSDAGQIEALAGDLIFVNPGEVHDGRPLSERGRSWRMLYLDIPIIQEAHLDATNDAAGDCVFAAPVLPQSRFRPIFESAFAAAISTDQDQLARLEEILLDIVAHLGSRKPRVDIPDSRIARRAKTRVDDDPTAPISCRELAAEAGVSRYQLHRAFIEHLGLAPHQYILQKRLALARRLIRAGAPLSQVAAATGFYDQSHMNRSFGRQFGISPGKYRTSEDQGNASASFSAIRAHLSKTSADR